MKSWLLFRVVFSGWALIWLVSTTFFFTSMVFLYAWMGRSEASIQTPARAWARWLARGVGCPAKVLGLENLEPGASYVFASNHTSALDILALFCVLPENFRWIAKKELFGIPMFGPAMLRAGYIPIDRSDRRAALKSLINASQRIADGASVVIFPEGTRSKDGSLLPFKSGGMGLALKSGVPVVPVAITGARQALPPKKLLLTPGSITVRLGKPIPSADFGRNDREGLAAVVRERVAGLLEQAEKDAA